MATAVPPPPPPASGDGAADAPLEPAKKPATRRAPAAKKTPTSSGEPSTPPPPAPAAPAVPPIAPASPAAVGTTPYSALPAAPSSPLSVLALVLGIMGLVFSFVAFGLLPAIAGVILGHLALKREPHARGMAIAGLSTGYAGIGISILWGLVVLVPILIIWFSVAAAGLWGSM